MNRKKAEPKHAICLSATTEAEAKLLAKAAKKLGLSRQRFILDAATAAADRAVRK